MTSSGRILIVDDDLRLRNLVSTFLDTQGFETCHAADGEKALQIFFANTFDVVILDINLPITSGLIVCKKIRRSGINIPIIMLTARGEESDRINGLEMGADDYLTKPFSPRELVARIRAVLRRYAIKNESLFESVKLKYRFGQYVLDLKKQQLLNGSEKVVHLSSGEFALLHLFLLEAGKPLTRDYLVAKMASREHQPDQRAIDMLVSRLRKKLNLNTDEVSEIRSLRGVGYMLIGDVAVEAAS